MGASSDSQKADTSFERYSCGELWAKRNSIFKAAGFCFTTPRAIKHFGNDGCRFHNSADVPLSSAQRQNVEAIRFAETVKGCSSSSASPPPSTPSAMPRQNAERGATAGTGFYVSDAGHLVTNAHVVDGCKRVEVSNVGDPSMAARIVAQDAINDLALLQIDQKPKAVAAFRTGVRLGENISVFGFPLAGVLATTGNFTAGNVTATAGLIDDTRMLQFSAPVQPGNSGGPLLDQSGNVVGVIVSKLNALKYAAVANDVPQNINFAIKSTVTLNFLEAKNVTSNSVGGSQQQLNPADVAERAKLFTVYVACQR